MAVAIAVALLICLKRARRFGCDPAVMTTISLIGVALGYLGCRGMHVLHYHGKEVAEGTLGVREAAAMGGGGEILGGVVLAILGVTGYLLARGKPVIRYLDLAVAPLILAMGIGRLGCFGSGCCFGGVCTADDGQKSLAWAASFPYASNAYISQWQNGAIQVPKELTWDPVQLSGLSKGEPQPEPIMPRLLETKGIDGNESLRRYVELREIHREKKAANPDDPALAAIDAEMKSLRSAVPGDGPQDKLTSMMLALHLHRLTENNPEGKPVTLADLRALAAAQTSLPVHPTQIYDAINLTLMFFLLSAIHARRRGDGSALAWAMILYPIVRFLMEMIRADNPRDVAGFTISQFISMLIFAAGIVFLVYLSKVRSARGVAVPARSAAT